MYMLPHQLNCTRNGHPSAPARHASLQPLTGRAPAACAMPVASDLFASDVCGAQDEGKSNVQQQAEDAAAAAVSKEAREAAVAAVRRAFASGKAAGVGACGFEGLGGMHAQKHALKEVVVLPLRVHLSVSHVFAEPMH